MRRGVTPWRAPRVGAHSGHASIVTGAEGQNRFLVVRDFCGAMGVGRDFPSTGMHPSIKHFGPRPERGPMLAALRGQFVNDPEPMINAAPPTN